MFKTFTQDDSLRYIYNEMENDEKMLFEQKLKSDLTFFQNYLEIKEAISFIDSTPLFDPSSFSIAVIRSMSTSFHLCKTDRAEFDHFLN